MMRRALQRTSIGVWILAFALLVYVVGGVAPLAAQEEGQEEAGVGQPAAAAGAETSAEEEVGYDEAGDDQAAYDEGFDDAGYEEGFDGGAQGGDFSEAGGEDVDLSAIEDLLREDEAVRTQTGASYDPGTRRDPFRSLVVRRNVPEAEERERPEGPAGLLIDEIVVEGVFELADGPVAQVQSAREETSYLLRPGDQLWDGDVVSIDLDKVVFKQTVKDPTALRPFREVVKRLNP